MNFIKQTEALIFSNLKSCQKGNTQFMKTKTAFSSDDDIRNTEISILTRNDQSLRMTYVDCHSNKTKEAENETERRHKQ